MFLQLRSWNPTASFAMLKSLKLQLSKSKRSWKLLLNLLIVSNVWMDTLQNFYIILHLVYNIIIPNFF